MKIYHTETQADYDALMVELEEQGCKWISGDEPSQVNAWKVYKNQVGIMLDKDIIRHSSLDYYQVEYPTVPIIKYKAKADDKMKFTKENVMLLLKTHGGVSLDEAIKNLDDSPEKVVVPKFVAEWIEFNRSKGVRLSNLLACYREIRDNPSNPLGKADDAGDWYVDNPYKFIQAYEDGYTIEPEQLYYIPLPSLETSDGLQQVLSKRKNDTNYFASRPNEKLKQRYTKEELERVPDIYKPFAKPIEEEE